MKPRSAFALFSVLALACTRPGEERTKRDLDVGHAASAGLTVNVASGLAAVRSLSGSAVSLWQSAPSLELELVAADARQVELDIDNTLPLGELRDDAGVLVTPAAGEGAKHKTWSLALPTGSSRFRLAARDATEAGAFSFALLSDVQEAIDRVQDIYRVIDAEPGLSFVLGAGDLTEEGDDDELARFQGELGGLLLPYYTTLGNHEVAEGEQSYQKWFGRANFQFVHRGVYFTFLDSASASIDPLADEWLDAWLTNGRASVHVFVTHIPPLDPIGTRNAGFASRSEAAALLAKLASAGVDLTLYGHIHSFYAFQNAGIPARISGGGGARPERADHIGRHFMAIEVDAARGVLGMRVVPVDHGDAIDEDD
jgi:predicted phosphodiesterase